MKNVQHRESFTERERMSRIDATLRINYQIISDAAALNDPYDPNFMLPRYFLLLAELDQFDHALNYELEQLNEKDQQINKILSLINTKLDLLTGAFYDSLVQSMLPIPNLVHLSETELVFYSTQALHAPSYIHMTLSHPDHALHIAATARVTQSYQHTHDSFRVYADFIHLLPQDRGKIAKLIAHLSACQQKV